MLAFIRLLIPIALSTIVWIACICFIVATLRIGSGTDTPKPPERTKGWASLTEDDDAWAEWRDHGGEG